MLLEICLAWRIWNIMFCFNGVYWLKKGHSYVVVFRKLISFMQQYKTVYHMLLRVAIWSELQVIGWLLKGFSTVKVTVADNHGSKAKCSTNSCRAWPFRWIVIYLLLSFIFNLGICRFKSTKAKLETQLIGFLPWKCWYNIRKHYVTMCSRFYYASYLVLAIIHVS